MKADFITWWIHNGNGPHRGTDLEYHKGSINQFAEEHAGEVAEKYANFCVICDRNKLPLIKFNDFIKLYYEEEEADKKED